MHIKLIPARSLGVEPPKPKIVARSPFPNPSQVTNSINHYEDLISLLSSTSLSSSSKRAEVPNLLREINDAECNKIFNNNKLFNQLKKLGHKFAAVVATRSEQFRISKN